MTQLKITGKPTAAAMQALEPHIVRLYDKPGLRIMAIVELAHMERLEPGPGSDKTAFVAVKITSAEVPTPDQEGLIREAQKALYLARTAHGTLDDDGTLQLDAATLKLLPGMLNSFEVARLRAGLAHWAEAARRVVTRSQAFSVTEMAHELQAIAEGLTSVMDQADNATEES